MKQFLFFDPHPGFMGAAVPIPEEIKAIADSLAGATLTLGEAVDKLQAAKIGTIILRPGFIALKLGGGPEYACHFFCVIKYKEILGYDKP